MQAPFSRVSRPIALALYFVVGVFMLAQPELALANFEKATNAAQTFKDWLWLIIPIVALIIAAFLGLLYSAEIIRKDTLVQWGIGIVFIGAIAGGVIKLFF
ncbi:TrbC/VirB2 family protein [Bordetella petrii]|uniref:TrbC/VirB2 family protein n=1 Tax=Bordetella petrii TaxID=94624 RepID=UPI0004B50340|nr:TrbC/VirB2 family protein [Bordetella petrii]